MNYLIMMIQQYGVGFVFLNVLALQAGVPVPAYPALIVAGAYAAMGGRPLWQLVAVGIAGLMRSPDGDYLSALWPGVDALRQIRAWIRIGGDGDGRCDSSSLCGFRSL